METWEVSVGWSLVVIGAMAFAFNVLLQGTHKQGSHSGRKLLALLPIVPIFIYLPWLPSSCLLRTFFSIVLLWTAPSKLLLLCFNCPLDPLSWVSSSFSHFLFSTLLPIRVSYAYGNGQGQGKKQQNSGYGTACLKSSLLIFILNSYIFLPPIPLPILNCLYCIQFYLGLELWFNAITSLFSACFSVDLLPPFNSPVLASSLSDLWGRRWNTTVNGILRATVYIPVISVLTGKLHRLHKAGSTEQKPPVPIWARAVSTLATFTVSGVMHEIIFVYVSKSEPTGEMIAFFIINGFAVIGEMAMKKASSGSSIKLPRYISTLYVATFLYVTGSLFFLGPLRRSGTDLQAIAEYHQLQNAVVSPFQNLYQSHFNSSRQISN